MHGEEWFSLEWAHKIIHYYRTLVQSQYPLMKWKWHTYSGEDLMANVKLKWLCFSSLRINEHNLKNKWIAAEEAT